MTRPGQRRVKGCFGCLGRLVVLALLAWPIAQLAGLLGWSDAATGSLLLVVLAVLAIGASTRGRASTRQGEAAGARGAQAAGSTALDRHRDRMRRPINLRAAWDPVFGSVAAGTSSQRWSGARAERPARRAGTPAGDAVGKARDPLPAQLRFSVLQRDGFRCRYCGRPGSAPGVVLHVDHVVPLAAGGTTTEGNLLTACEECNLGKATRAVVPGGS